MSVYQINNCEHGCGFITCSSITKDEDIYLSFNKNKNWGYDALSSLNFKVTQESK